MGKKRFIKVTISKQNIDATPEKGVTHYYMRSSSWRFGGLESFLARFHVPVLITFFPFPDTAALSDPLNPKFRALMAVSYCHNPNCVPSNDVCNIVWECAKIHSAITPGPQPGEFGKSENPIHNSGNLRPKPRSQSRLSGFIVSH
jgi:hypothetical protein